MIDLSKFVGRQLNATYIDGETVSGKCVLYVPAKDNDGKKRSFFLVAYGLMNIK
jgi:hypothetical protein